ncbi:MAG: alginate export family protein [Bernardetiaceae bacterium]|nr:alginate export family protein [Bernardetiaceae bacterium]
MLRKLLCQGLAALALTLCASAEVLAQFSLQGQVRTRSEYRNGLGTLSPQDADPAFFTSQRTRLTFGYKWDRVLFQTAVQDVRVWGQDASSISNADGNKLMLHEAWADVTLANVADTTFKFRLIDNLNLKIGRQELVYDDVRLLGNLDWLQQARRHDAVVLKAQHRGWQVDLGGAFNQNTDAFGVVGTGYAPGNTAAYLMGSRGGLVEIPVGFIPTAGKGGAPRLSNAPSTNGLNQQYKSMQFLYVARKFGQTKLSALLFKDDFGKYALDSVGNATAGYVYGRNYRSPAREKGVNSRFTYGLMMVKTMGNASGLKAVLTLAGYLQSGKNRDGRDLNAYHYTAGVSFQKGKFSFGPGIDYLSGNEAVGGGAAAVSTSTTDNRFDPLYGTPHKFWGFMDYFYVGTGSPVGGLNNPWFKVKYTAKDLSVGLDYHYFALARPQSTRANEGPNPGAALNNYLGSEVDLLVNYQLNKFTNLEFGYSFMRATSSLEYSKLGTLDRANLSPTWAYLMINIRPDFFFTKPVAIKN